MQGFQLTFFTAQDRKHAKQPLAEWLVQVARALGIGGATVATASEGFGRDGKLRAAHFFELAGQPVEVTMALSAEDAERLFAHLRTEQVKVFYVKTPIEYGVVGED